MHQTVEVGLSSSPQDSEREWWNRTPEEAAANRKPRINARIEKALTGRYFRHMFREGRVIIPAGGWYEWLPENGRKQPWSSAERIGSRSSWPG